MVQGYYTLQEAAQVLGMDVDELKGIAQKNQIRSFQDRGTLRFRIQDVQELYRQRLGNSDPEMVLGDAISPKPAPASAPKSGVHKTSKLASAAKAEDLFGFKLQESVEVGAESLSAGSSAVRKAGAKSGPPKSGPKTPKQGSDSDVKLVADNSDTFSIQLGEDIKPNVGDSDVRLGEIGTNKKVAGGSSRRSDVGQRSRHGASPADSGVRLVPMQDDSDIRLGAHDPSATDSDIRLGVAPPSPRSHESMDQTEEINLDEEIKKLEAAAKKTPETKFQTDPSKLGKPGSPFELSDSDIDDKPKKDGTSDFEIAAAGAKTPKPKRSPKSGAKKSTEFELAAGGDSDEDFSLELDDGAEGSPRSGINLGRPSDKGISLENKDDSDDSAFELNFDGGHSTPKPAKDAGDSDSEFELSLDDSSAETPALKDASDDSAFELSLGDDSATEMGDSDGDFELALDDSDSDEKPAPKGKAKGKAKAAAADQDLFETDFELPALDEDGSSDDSAVDGGSSDFELALDDSDMSVEDESGSQVVALDEEDDVAGETVDGDLEEADVEDGDIEEDEEAPVRQKVVVQEVVRDRWVKPAPWGPVPVIFMLPCVIVMVLVGIMGWELVQTSSGFKASGVLTKSVAEMMNLKVK